MMCVEVVVALEAARSLEFSVWGGQPRNYKVKCVTGTIYECGHYSSY